jgi:hypothetical protein
MAKSLPPLWFTQLFDNLGDVLAGGKVQTYAGGTTTPLATYTDSGGLSTNANPVVLDSAGRADIWLTAGVSYKFVLMDSSDNVLETVDGIIATAEASAATTVYEVLITYLGTPTVQGWMGGIEFKRTVTFPVDFDASGGSAVTAPGTDFEISVRKNGAEVGTITIDSDGVFTFETTGGATVSFISGDTMDLYGPSSLGTAANIKITLVGAL